MKFRDALQKYINDFKTPEYTKKIIGKDAFIESSIPLLKLMPVLGFLPMDFKSGLTKGPTRNRSFVTGIMTEAHAESFIYHMAVYTDKVAIIIPIVDSGELYQHSIPITLETKNNKLTVTKEEFNVLSEDDYKELYKMFSLDKKENIVYILCWDPIWNRDASSTEGLFTYMISILKYISKN